MWLAADGGGDRWPSWWLEGGGWWQKIPAKPIHGEEERKREERALVICEVVFT